MCACGVCEEKEASPVQAGMLFDEEGFAELLAQKQRERFFMTDETASAPDAKRLTVDFAVKAVPFEIEEGGSAVVYLREQKIPLRLKDGILEGSARVPIETLSSDNGSLEYRILLQNGKTLYNQVVVPSFFFHVSPFVGEVEAGAYADGQQDFAVSYVLDDAYMPFGDTAESAMVYAHCTSYSEDAEPETNYLMFLGHLEDGFLFAEESIDLGSNDRLRFYAEVTGKSGLVYRYWLYDFVAPEYEDVYAFPWWDQDMESEEYINISSGKKSLEFWF
jgi:hypothetical protein